MNIRARLTLQFILLTAGIFLTALVFIDRQFGLHVENEFFSLLESKARMTGEMVLNNDADLKPIALPTVKSELRSTGNTSIFDENLHCVFSINPSAGFLDEKSLEELHDMGTCRMKRNDFFVFGVTLVNNSGRSFLVVSEEKPDFSKLSELRNILLLTFFLILAAVATGGWFYAGQALRPVSRIVDAVDEILPADLSRRLQADNQHDEISHLVGTFNRLLDRIEHAFQMQRSFISNVSHELKNPLAAMDAQLQLARSKTRSPEEYSAVITSLHDDVQELSDTTSKLLQLAKVNSDAQGIQFSEVRLDELIYQARAALLKTRPDATVRIEITDLPENEDQLCIEGNEPLLRTALLNLFDNGCKFSSDNRVEVSIGFNREGLPEIGIHNEGEAIPAGELPRIFEPFFRSSKHISLKGSGIGLSLVQTILRLHGVVLGVESTAEKGTTFLMKFSKTKNSAPVVAKKSVDLLSENAAAENASAPARGVNGRATQSVLKKAFQSLFIFSIVCFSGIHCEKSTNSESAEFQQANFVLKNYNEILLLLVRSCEGYRPPVSARMYAYMGLAAWETSRPALPSAQSITSICPGLELPKWAGDHEKFVLPVALDACYRTMAEHFFPHRIMYVSEKGEERIQQYLEKNTKNIPKESIESSRKFGENIAMAVYNWSATDTVGHQAYLYLFNKNYIPPQEKGHWQPTGVNPMPAMLPNWGKARTFVVGTAEVSANPPKAFSEDRSSPFFAEAMELYTLSRPLSKENHWIAEYWSDDFAGVSFCAASRWVSITNQAVVEKASNFPATLETYLKIGLALNDAAVKCWSVKYQFTVERPESFIHRNIAKTWAPLHESPPFPAYPSGHATFGNAAATVLAELLGDKIELSDRSHEGRKEFLSKPRHFHSFQEMAKENALSRLFEGVHFRMDSEEGFRLGGIIGGKVAALNLWTAPDGPRLTVNQGR